MRKLSIPNILSVFFISIFILLTANSVYASGPTVFLDGRELTFDVPPTIENGRTLVPMRVIFEALGAELYWDGDTQTASAFKGDTGVAVQVGNSYANKNNTAVKLDVPPKIVNGRTLIPLRFVSEAFGCEVKWDESTQTVSIMSKQAATDKSIIGYWSDNAYSGTLVNPFNGMIVGSTYSGQWFKFSEDGTFRYAIAGSGTIITGISFVEGNYRIEGSKIIFSDCKETFYKNFISPQTKDKPIEMDPLEFKFNEGSDELKIGFDVYHRVKE